MARQNSHGLANTTAWMPAPALCVALNSLRNLERLPHQITRFQFRTSHHPYQVGDRSWNVRTPLGAGCYSKNAGRCLIVILSVDKSRHMESQSAIDALSALAQPTRLDVFRLLVRQEPDGLPAGEIARRLDVPHNTMSTHLGILTRARLVTVERHSRSMIYRVELPVIRQLVLFLLRDCCNGQPALCSPIIEDLSICCSTEGAPCG